MGGYGISEQQEMLEALRHLDQGNPGWKIQSGLCACYFVYFEQRNRHAHRSEDARRYMRWRKWL
jgi:hypothetical protein